MILHWLFIAVVLYLPNFVFCLILDVLPSFSLLLEVAMDNLFCKSD